MVFAIPGAAGSIGNAVARRAPLSGHQVRAVVRDANRRLELPAGTDVRAADLLDPQGVRSSRDTPSRTRSRRACSCSAVVTYEGMAGYWPSQKGEVADFMNAIPKVVFSRTLKKAEWKNTRLVKGDAAQEVAELKKQPGKDLFVFGSANLSSILLDPGLFDELDLAVAPVILGRGNPLFKAKPDQLKMKLLEARPLKSGGVILRYEPERKK